MKFILDKARKIAFGYSAKAGCSHIKKIFWYLKENNLDHKIHHNGIEYQDIPGNYKDYTFVVIVRNPYERLVSGFLNKYNSYPVGECRRFYKSEKITFEGFVDYLVRKECRERKHIHHFCPQTEEFFDLKKLREGKKLVVYDLKNIDYNFIGNLYNKKIPESLINYRGNHSNQNVEPLQKPVFSLDMLEYNKYKVPVNFFYNNSILEKVKNFYKNDFAVLKKFNIQYPDPI